MKNFLILFFVFITAKGWGAACCGGAAQISSLITAEDQQQMTTQLSHLGYNYEVDGAGYWSAVRNHSFSESLRFDFARLISEKNQMGFSVPFTKNGNDQVTNTSPKLGDVTLTFGRRFFEQEEVSSFPFQVLNFASLTIPSGRSLEDSQDLQKLDVTGKGDYIPAVGVILVRDVAAMDYQLTAEIHRPLDRKVNNLDGKYEKKYGVGGSLTLGAGWNHNRFRIGGSVGQIYEDPVQLQGDIDTKSSLKRTTVATLSGTYLLPDLMSLTLSYSDQSLLGEPVNSSLSQSIQFSIQKRWARE